MSGPEALAGLYTCRNYKYTHTVIQPSRGGSGTSKVQASTWALCICRIVNFENAKTFHL